MATAVSAARPIQPPPAGRKQKVLTVRSIVKPQVDMDLFVDTAGQMIVRLAKEKSDRLQMEECGSRRETR
ncbi:hypothetical protein [Arthrobacter sp. MA-N2]|uniref:hypothetical protein n=1 Tax=Arthrobacter sp. MA-N2 TaxID=1101188 RepID=UPI0012DDF6DF|nr:hypothetical protein [Arthrobacter sp. MA-N2]